MCWLVQPLIASEALDVSMAKIIANPEDYQDKIVRVIGFVRIEFEGDAIYFHREDYEHRLTKNGFWIDVTTDISKKKADFDKKYVLVEGTFSASDKGHMGLFSGSIHKITRFQVWMPSDEKK
jgi:hypothetical protein